jgi:hypothetical protein
MSDEKPEKADGKTGTVKPAGKRTTTTESAEEPKLLPVHPLIAGLAASLEQDVKDALKAGVQNAEAGAVTALDAARAIAGAGLTVKPDVINNFGTGSQSAKLIVIAGYLGGQAEDNAGVKWQVVFTNHSASEWLVVPVDAIKLHSRIDDRKAAYGLRDLIWVGADTPVGSGDTSSSVQSLFLSGGLISAGDFAASPQAGTVRRGGGLAEESTSPLCCGYNSKH